MLKQTQRKIVVLTSVLSCVALSLMGASAWKRIDRKPTRNLIPQISKHYIETHRQLIERAKGRPMDLVFIGDSLTAHWLLEGQEIWNKEFSAWRPGNFGLAGDTTYGVLWRLKQNAISGLHPKVVVVLIGTNDLSVGRGAEATAKAIQKVVQLIKSQLPDTTVVLLGLLPRGSSADPSRKLVNQVNEIISKLDNPQEHVVYLDVGHSLLDEKGDIVPEFTIDRLHLTTKGYRAFADALKPTLERYLKVDSSI